MSDDVDPDAQKPTILGRRLVARLERTLGVAAGLSLLVLMCVVTVDVIGRYLFSAPLRGGFEYIQICMAVVVFLALPVTTARDENVKVEVFEAAIPKRIRRQARLLGAFITLFILAGLVWISYLRASAFHDTGERFVLLAAPLYPVAYFIFAMWLICAVVVLLQFVRYPKFLRDAEAGE